MKPILAFLLLLSCATTKAQYNVTPGTGIDKVQLGMSVKDILGIIGQPSQIVGYEKEKQDWISFGYDVTETLVFSIPFDRVYIFNGARNSYAIWKIYTRNDTAVIFNQSSYQAAKDTTDKITISNDLHFYDDLQAVEKLFGSDYKKYIDERKNNHFIYKEKGVFFIINENQLRNVFLFTTPNKQPITTDCLTGQALYL